MNPCHSWDVFDTLIGRRCGTPRRLWEQVGREVEWPEFPALRHAAEATLQRTHEPYGLQDIHRVLKQQHGRECAPVEYDLECRNAFLIARYADQVCSGDLAVSDMYLGRDEVAGLLEYCRVTANLRVYVSCYGKTKGTCWPEILAQHHIVRHTGDNLATDVEGPRRHGIATEWADTGFSPAEALYAKYSEPLAWWTRVNRLSRDWPDPEIATLQIQCNAPLLLAACWDIRRVLRERNLTRVAFLARDGCLIGQMWARLFPEVPADYLWCSRECLRRATPDYVQYLAEHLTADTLVVDLAASFRSFAVLLPHLPVRPRLYTCFLVNYHDDPTVECDSLLDQRHLPVNNTYLEMINYARHWHVADVRDGRPVFDEPDEYDLGTVSRYHGTFNQLLDHLPLEPITRCHEIAEYAATQIHGAGKLLERRFPGHMKFEKVRRLPAVLKLAPVMTSDQPALVIVGAVDNLQPRQWKNWIRSIEIARVKCPVHILGYRLQELDRRHLRHHRITIHEGQVERHVVVDRFRDLATLARTLDPRCWIVSLDMTDIVLQRDPLEWLDREAAGHEIVVGSEAILIRDQWWVDRNLLDTFPEHYETARERLLYNAGSFAARAATMIDLAGDVWAMCCQGAYTKPNDQDAFNILLHHDRYRERTKFAEQREGWCANVAATVAEPPERGACFATEPLAEIHQGVCRVEHGVVPVLLHHYTRIPAWKRAVEDRLNTGRRC